MLSFTAGDLIKCNVEIDIIASFPQSLYCFNNGIICVHNFRLDKVKVTAFIYFDMLNMTESCQPEPSKAEF
jgi:hypothetical protein